MQLWLQVTGWDQFPGLVHGFSSRVRDHAFALSLLDDTSLSVRTVKQVHGNKIVVISQPMTWNETWDGRSEADGMITAEAGSLLSIATADCVPVLMVEPECGLVAALHAGWRGTLAGISVRAVEILRANWGVKPGHLRVALGPAISGCCYEVSHEVGAAFRQRWEIQSSVAWRPRGEKGWLDLRTINRIQCERAGIPPVQIQVVGPCTFCAGTRFASYRREGPGTDRQLNVIGWRNAR